MHNTTKLFRSLLLGGISAAALGGTAMAVPVSGPVGAYTAGVAVLSPPTVTTTTIGFNVPLFISSDSGEFFTNGAGKNGTGAGTIAYSTTVGVTTADILSNLLTFSDGSGGFYEFSAVSALTTNYSSVPGNSTTIALYILGNTFDTHLGETNTPTSMTLTLNSTGGSDFSGSFTLSNPPAPPPIVPTPEPMSMALLGVGLAGIGIARRRSAKA